MTVLGIIAILLALVAALSALTKPGPGTHLNPEAFEKRQTRRTWILVGLAAVFMVAFLITRL